MMRFYLVMCEGVVLGITDNWSKAVEHAKTAVTEHGASVGVYNCAKSAVFEPSKFPSSSKKEA